MAFEFKNSQLTSKAPKSLTFDSSFSPLSHGIFALPKPYFLFTYSDFAKLSIMLRRTLLEHHSVPSFSNVKTNTKLINTKPFAYRLRNGFRIYSLRYSN